MIGLWLVGGMAVGVFAMKRAADRFAAAKRRAGEWDENGPKHPTEPAYRDIGKVRVSNAFANLAPDVDADADVEELRERDLPGISDLVQGILELLLDGSDPSHEVLRGQLRSIRIGDIDLGKRAVHIRVDVAPSAPRCSPAELQGGVVEIRVERVDSAPCAGAVVQDGCFSAVIIDTFGSRWPRDAEISALRLIEPLVPTES